MAVMNKVVLVMFGIVMSAIPAVSAMYESAASKVVNLNSANFKKMVLDSDEMWFVEFYAPWCGHCQQLEPSWEKTAKMLKGAVKVGAVNVDQEQSLGQ